MNLFTGEDPIIGALISKVLDNSQDSSVLITIFVFYLIYKLLNKGVKKAPIVPNTVEEVVSTALSFVPGLNVITKLFKK